MPEELPEESGQTEVEEEISSAAEEEAESEEEYLFEEEVVAPGTLDVKALEALVDISDILTEAIKSDVDPKEVAERIIKIQEGLVRTRRRRQRRSSRRRRRS